MSDLGQNIWASSRCSQLERVERYGGRFLSQAESAYSSTGTERL